MNRKAKILALLGLLSLVLLGFLYWGFLAPESSAAVQPTKTDIFADTFARGEFERCYRMMGEDYQAKTPQAEFVYHWEGWWYTQTHIPSLGRYREIIRLTSPTPNELYYEIRYEAAVAQRPDPLTLGATQTQVFNATIVLHLTTRHGNSTISSISIDKDSVRMRWVVLTPTPKQDPIS